MTAIVAKGLAAAALLLLSACSSVPPTACGPLGSSVCGQAASYVARDVQGWHNANNPNCAFVRPIAAEIIGRDRGGVTEHWTIEACQGKRFVYKAYIIRLSGGLTVAVSDVGA
jgi:hypothetical protein